MNYLILDISTAPIEGAERFLSDEDFSAPSNYGVDASAKFIANAKAKAIEQCALDPDLCRLSGAALDLGGEQHVFLLDPSHEPASLEPADSTRCTIYTTEAGLLDQLANYYEIAKSKDVMVSFNGLKFDWPVLNARARYLGVKLNISLDKYRNKNIDLYAYLTNHGALKGHSLRWWVRRHGWDDLHKPLEGAEEAKVFQTKRWAELSDSLCHDVEATRRLAAWLGVI